MQNSSNKPSLKDSMKQKQDENNFFVKRSTSGLSQGKQQQHFSEPPIVSVDPEQSGASTSGKKGKKKKKKRAGAKSQAKTTSSFPDPLSASKDKSAHSFGKVSTSGNNFTGSYSQNDFEDDISASKSLASLGDLPAPLKQQKTTTAAVQGF